MNYFVIDNLVYGGAERQATYLINNNLNFNKIILLENEQKYEVATKIPIEALSPEILKVSKRIYEDRKSIRILKKIFNSNDTVISFLERSNLINIKTAKETGHKTIISVRNYLSERYNHPKYLYRKNQIKKYYNQADIVVTNSIESKKDLILNFNVAKDKILVIYNLIDLKKIEIMKKDKLIDSHNRVFQNPVIINIGSLTPQKSQRQLIDAFPLIKKKYPEYKLVIIGSGKEEKKLLKKIKKLNLENDIYILGNVKNPFKYLSKSDIFVLNSTFEGFPNVLLESLAVGTPVVTKNCPSGPMEMLEAFNYDNEEVALTDYGYIFPKIYNVSVSSYSQEIEYLVEGIFNLIEMKKCNSEDLQLMKEKCKKRASDFSESKIIQQWVKLLNC